MRSLLESPRDTLQPARSATLPDLIPSEKVEELVGRLEEQYAAQQRLDDAVPCGIVRYTVDDDMRIVFMNKCGCALLGYRDLADYRAGTGDHALMPIHEDDVSRHREVIELLKQGSPPVDFLYRYYQRDGSIGWLEGMSALDADIDGRPLVQSAFIDVTDRQRKRHETDLQRYSLLLCSIYEEIFEFDFARGMLRMLFSGTSQTSGASVPFEAALSRLMSQIPEDEDRALLLETIGKCRQSGEREVLNCMYRLKSGDRTEWRQSTFLRVSPTSMLCCNKDVTERLSAEERKVSERIADTMGRLPVGVGMFSLRDGEAYPLYVNDLMCTMFGCSAEDYAMRIQCGLPVLSTGEMSGVDVAELVGKPLDLETKLQRLDGTPLDVRIQGRAMRDGGDVLLYSVITDITQELRNRHERLWQTERYRLLSEMTHAISFDYDSKDDTVLLYLDRTGEGMEAQVIPRYFETLCESRSDVLHPGSIDVVRKMFERVRAGSTKVDAEYQADYYDRGYAWYRANLFVVHDDADTWHLVGLIEDIDDERELRFRAEHDAMTGLCNPAATKDRITATLADPDMRACSICVALDLDDFKQVNDTCGHIQGDVLLHEVGGILRSGFRKSDIIGRIGGDEFVLLLKRIDLQTALLKLERIRQQVIALKERGAGWSPSISIGVYETQPEDRTYQDVFAKADEALYRAKRSGKNRVEVYRNTGIAPAEPREEQSQSHI